MSKENVETVLRVFDAFDRREERAMFAAYAPDVEWSLVNYTSWPETPVYHGHEGIRSFFRTWLQDFERYETRALDPLDLGDKVLVTVYDRAEGKGSGVPIERYHAQVWFFRDGRAVRVEVWDTREDALRTYAPEGEREGG
jgi:ketosteroid isomerase-like protein